MRPTRSLEAEWLGMTRPRTGLVLVLWAVMAASGCGGCEPRANSEHANPPTKQEPESATPGIPLEPQFLRLDRLALC